MLKRRVLIVDDERDIIETLKFRLEGEGLEVITAYDGEEGLAKAKTQRPDLILLDVLMPKKNGFEVCRELKRSQEWKDIPIIMVTVKDRKEDKFQALLNEKADGYIVKPFDSDKLVKQIKDILKKP